MCRTPLMHRVIMKVCRLQSPALALMAQALASSSIVCRFCFCEDYFPRTGRVGENEELKSGILK